MPRYNYRCARCGVYEAVGGFDERFIECECGETAERRPYSGIAAIKGATVATSIPDPSYRREAEKRELNQTWGDASRAVEMLRKARKTDADGKTSIDLKAMA